MRGSIDGCRWHGKANRKRRSLPTRGTGHDRVRVHTAVRAEGHSLALVNNMSWDMMSCEEERQDVSCASKNQTYSTHDSCRVECISHSAALSCVLFGFSAQISSGVFAQQKALARRTGTCAGLARTVFQDGRMACALLLSGGFQEGFVKIGRASCRERV